MTFQERHPMKMLKSILESIKEDAPVEDARRGLN